MNTKLKVNYLHIILIFSTMMLFTCDDQKPKEIEADTLNIFVSSTPISNGQIVGEDIINEIASTRIVATVQDAGGDPVKNALITFSAKVNKNSYGSFDLASDRTDESGQVVAIFFDNGVAAVDDPTSPEREGVTVTAKYNEKSSGSVNFDVYNSVDEVWPYKIFISSNVQSIFLDNGETKAIIETRITNKKNKPLIALGVTFETNKGYIETDGITGANGTFQLEFKDLGETSDIGIANIIGSYHHPGIGNSIVDSIQIMINSDYAIELQSYPIAFDGNTVTRVGEDIVGDIAFTQLLAIVTDVSGNLVEGIELSFSGILNNEPYGTFDYESVVTDFEGVASAIFYDGGTKAVDDLTTATYEGVKIIVSYGEQSLNTTKFDVYGSVSEIWPYKLNMSSDVESIFLDNGTTLASLQTRLKNQNDVLLPSMLVTFETNKGFIEPIGNTDNNGLILNTFQDLGLATDVGIAKITSSFYHPGIDSTSIDSIQIMILSEYAIELIAYPIAYDGNFATRVGEDIVGDAAFTQIVAIVTDEVGNNVEGVELQFSGFANNQAYGTVVGNSFISDFDGMVSVIFEDSNFGAVDNPLTTTYEGAKVFVSFGDELINQVKFDVYGSISDVWPYKVFVSSDVDNIVLDNGVTVAQIETQLINNQNVPLSNLSITFETNKGYIGTSGVTDVTGTIIKEFTDLGQESDIGVANIIGSFEHPGINQIAKDSVQISIMSGYSISMESFPIAMDGSTITRVGEDVSGPYARTMIVATILDTADNPVTGAFIQFTAISLGIEVGSIEANNPNTNSLGQVIAFFDDGGTIYQDIPSTPNFEGVRLVGQYGDDITASTRFNVYDQDDVWPYTLLINTNTDVIYVDNGVTQAEITVRLLNHLNKPVSKVDIAFESDNGFIPSTGITDSVGVDTVYFTDLGDPMDVGLTSIQASFYHPGFASNIQQSVQVNIEDVTFGECGFIEIPPSSPGEIVVMDGGGIEATIIRAEIYDPEHNLINVPTLVNFLLQGAPDGTHLNDGGLFAQAYTADGVASVTVNSGGNPGPVQILVTVDCDEDGVIDLESVSVPVVIASGAPYYIVPNYDPQNTTSTGGGFYETEAAAMVYDRWYNPVECSTYVYWTIDPIPPDTIITAEVDGASFTCNENSAGDSYPGLAYTYLRYDSEAIGELGRVSASTYGVDGELISATIDNGEAEMFFIPGEVILSTDIQYWNFTLQGNPAIVTATVRVIDLYGNPIDNVPIQFGGIGINEWIEVGYESYTDIGVGGAGVNDGCFTWRDYGLDNEPGTLDIGENNDDHDGYDTNNDDIIDYSEVSEPFDDFGLDGTPGTLDEGEGDGEWNGYHMINCEQIVKTDADGVARIQASFDIEICILQNQDNNVDPPVCSYEDFQASISSMLIIPTITTSDPVEVQLVRSPDNCGQ